MVLDQVENFIRVSVSGSHASGDSTISLQSGEASTLPDPSNGKYNLVWFDSQNYQLPDKDPNVEIVRVNSVDTANDTVSVTRGQENTTATTKSETGAEYELLLGPTAKTIQEIDQFKLDSSAYSPEADTHARYTDSEALDAINGSVIEPEQAIHSRSIDNDLTLSSDQGLVLAGPVSGSGSISGNGSFVVAGNSLGESEVINIIQSQSIDADTLDGFDASQLGIDVSNNASTIVSNATDINFGSGLSAVDDADGTSTISAESVSHDTLTNIESSDHHTKYTDSEAVSAVNGESSLSVDISGDADSVDGYDIQKNGSDGTDIINFKT